MFGYGNGPILMDNVMCNGLEYRLFDCRNAGWQVHNCNHLKDAGVSCAEGTLGTICIMCVCVCVCLGGVMIVGS